MPNYTAATADIRNVCFLGHGGNGKTSLVEAMLYLAKETDRLGKISDGNTVSDFDAEEIRRKFSLSATVTPFLWKNKKINCIDTPGYLDFVGEVMQGLRAADCALIVLDAKSGIDVGCELAYDYAQDEGIAKAFFVNKMDDENANFDHVLRALREKYGVSVCPVMFPVIRDRKVTGYVDLIRKRLREFAPDGSVAEKEIPEAVREEAAEYRNLMMEALAETSDALMEKYFGDVDFETEETCEALRDGMKSGVVTPVFAGSATELRGVFPLLEEIAAAFPSPLDRKEPSDIDGNAVAWQENGPAGLFVFKTVADPFVGKMSYFRVMSGTVKRDMVLNNLTTGLQEKLSHLYVMKGKKQIEVESLACGDIGVTTKLANTNTNDTLTEKGEVRYAHLHYPEPFLCMAILPKAKGDEDKISTGLAKLLEEDRTIRYENNSETKQMLIYGLGEQHLDVILAKLKSRFGTSVELAPPKIAYRETIKKAVDAEGKHKKQSGGHGQYGHVKIHFEPGEEQGLVFTETIFGGSVPKNFHPAVEKGLLEAMQKGVLAGYPVVHLKANLYDGSYHDVDSSEMSFKMAASLAYKDGLKRANPIILEPVGSLKVWIPEEDMGDVIGDLNKRRGRVLGMNPADKKGWSLVEAEVPQSEMANYTISLRALTQGRGKFEFRFLDYEEAPAQVAQKVIEQAQKDAVEE